MRRTIPLLFAIALLVCMVPLPAKAQRSEIQKKSLRGLKGVYVLVEFLTEDGQRQGLDDSQLQTDAELRLRKANVHVATQTEMIQSDNIGTLYINVGTMQLRDV